MSVCVLFNTLQPRYNVTHWGVDSAVMWMWMTPCIMNFARLTTIDLTCWC